MYRRRDWSRRAVRVEPLEGRVFLSAAATGSADDRVDLAAPGEALVVAAAPTITGQFIETPRQSIQFTFSQPVRTVNLDDLHVVNLATGVRVSPNLFFLNSSGTTDGSINGRWMPVNPLPRGNYRATLPAGSFSNTAGEPNEEYSITFTVTIGETTPPTVTSAEFVETPRQEIRINFSEDVMDSVDLDDLRVVRSSTGQRVDASDFFANVRGGPDFPTEATWVPFEPLPAGQYTATLPAGSVADANGNALAANYSFTFQSTAGPVAPSVTSAVYQTYANGMGKEVEVTFSEGVRETDVRAARPVFTNRDTGEVMRGTRNQGFSGGPEGVVRAEWGGQSVLPTGNYRFTLPANSVHDADGNPMAADFVYDFSVGPQPDNAPPTLLRGSYEDWPSPQQHVRFAFNESVIFGIDPDALSVTNLDSGQGVPFTGGIWSETIADWQPTAPLPVGHYRAVLEGAGIRDAWGNALATDPVVEFEVTGPGDRTPPTVLATRLVESSQHYWSIEIDFSENVLGTIDEPDLVVTDLTTGEVLDPFRFGAGAGGGPLIPTKSSWLAVPVLPHGPYRATLRAGSVADPSGNALAADYTFEFTVPNTDTTPPIVFERKFVPGERPYVEYYFSEDVRGSVTADDLILTNSTTGQRVPPTSTVVDFLGTLGKVGWFINPGALPPGRYTARLAAGGVTDRSGNAVAEGPWTLVVPGVVGRHLFYNNSVHDGRDPAADARDDAAIANDKQAYVWRAGQPWNPSFASVSSFTKGINGVILDVVGLPIAAATSAYFRAYAGTDPANPTPMPQAPPGSFTVRPGAGAGGSDRVTVTWPDRAIANKWLRVEAYLNGTTQPASDVFFFGNLIGETGDGNGGLRVNALDVAGTKRALTTIGTAPVTNRFDFDRDGRVNALDVAAVKGNLTRTLNPPVVAQALAATDSSSGATDLLRDE